eukprot:4581990-Pleurochrysis_carterae.AAC.1
MSVARVRRALGSPCSAVRECAAPGRCWWPSWVTACCRTRAVCRCVRAQVRVSPCHPPFVHAGRCTADVAC